MSSMSDKMMSKSAKPKSTISKPGLKMAIGVGMIVCVGALAGCQGGLGDLAPKAQRAVPKKLIKK